MPIRATQRLYRERPNGSRELAYAVGAIVSDEDAIALGLIEKPEKPAQTVETAAAAAEPGTKPTKRTASRDRQTSKRTKP